MSTPTSYDPTQTAFQTVVREFRTAVKEDVYKQILATKTIDDVYDATDKLQQQQAKEGHLRHLAKIQPFLENLREYAAVIEVFLQAKPDVLALLWGPIKLLLHWTNSIKQSFDAITNTLCNVGVLLPEFKDMAKLFRDNHHVKDVLLLFFRDILDLYTVALKFFGQSRWKFVFESMWPGHREEIKVITNNIERHTLLLRNEVRLEHIQEEHEARIRAIQHFEKAQRSHVLQEFQAIKTDVSPASYENKLDWLQGRVCAGTDNWLISDPAFKKWINTADLSTRLLWLQGIPGAGKTFLAGLVVKRAAVLRPNACAYAFLSYNQANSTSALSVLHSLLFQLGTANEELKSVLCKSSRANIKSDIKATVDLLATAINHIAPTFLTIDGLDEIELIERSRLLEKLLHLSNVCKEVKILVSSRAESDIDLALKDCPTIRVDNHNSRSIERYVINYTDNWYKTSEFPVDMQSEIRVLLSSLPTSSQGMFLYARIILQIISNFDEIEDIRSELLAPPKSLNEAYARIFDRINSLPSTAKDKARRLLSWVGCSPTPLTLQELEAALLIKPEHEDCSLKLSAKLNVTKLCGPIVEVVDETVQFVHFTVKEYIFSSQIPNHIVVSDAMLELALCCILYLRQDHHHNGITDDDIIRHILAGSYRLHNLSMTLWYSLTEKYASLIAKHELSTRLLEELELFMDERCVQVTEHQTRPQVLPHAIRSLESTSPDIYAFLCAVKNFKKDSANSAFNLNDAHWTNLDPTLLSQLSMRIHLQINDLLNCGSQKSVDCKCEVLKQHYGSRPFKCTFISCRYHRDGFQTYTLRKAHMREHEHPWHCDAEGCEFASRGFLSRKMRDEHWELCHKPEKFVEGVNEEKDDLDKRLLLLDLIEDNQVEHVRALLSQMPEMSKKYERQFLRASAIVSPDIFRLFYHQIVCSHPSKSGIHYIDSLHAQHEKFFFIELLKTSANAGNLETFRCILFIDGAETGSLLYKFIAFKLQIIDLTMAVLSTGNEILWEEFYSALNTTLDLSAHELCKDNCPVRWQELLLKIRGQRSKENMLCRIWGLLLEMGIIGQKHAGQALSDAVQSRSSFELIEICLKHGADIDYRYHARYFTPLHHVALRSSAQAAEIIKFLLFRGANPHSAAVDTREKPERDRAESDSKEVRRAIRDERGPREIEKWLGVSWDELVAQAEEHRGEPWPRMPENFMSKASTSRRRPPKRSLFVGIGATPLSRHSQLL